MANFYLPNTKYVPKVSAPGKMSTELFILKSGSVNEMLAGMGNLFLSKQFQGTCEVILSMTKQDKVVE